MKTMRLSGLFCLGIFLFAGVARAASVEVDVYEATKDGRGKALGSISIEETGYGLVFTPNVKGLTPGGHGFHIHTNADCGPGPDATTGETLAAGAAGGHFDPDRTGKHKHPWDDGGHLGDLPLLYVGSDGNATNPVLAPRLKSIGQIRNRAIMIHAGDDNYADTPKALGGGGARMACGVIR